MAYYSFQPINHILPGLGVMTCFLIQPDIFPGERKNPHWLSHTNYQSRKCLAGLPINQSDVGSPSIEVPFSQVFLVHVEVDKIYLAHIMTGSYSHVLWWRSFFSKSVSGEANCLPWEGLTAFKCPHVGFLAWVVSNTSCPWLVNTNDKVPTSLAKNA